MPASSADFPALGASTSSSGYSDGLGRRSLAFDREDGTMLERLAVRAELSAFERSLRDRLERIAALDDERIAKPRSIERGPDGALIVLSEFVPGSRMSELLDAVAQQGTVPGLDVALGYLLDVLPALCGLHAGAGFAHGAITPGRTVLTPAGQVVLLDGIFGEALSRLQYNRRRLWSEFGIAMASAPGPPRFDPTCDLSQTALCAVMLMIGRPIEEYEYPDAIPSMLVEVVDVAQIRGSSDFATGLQHFLQRALPLPGRRPYTAADDALIDVRDLARELGLDVCRRALLEFIEQQESGGSTAILSSGDTSEYSYEYGADEFAASTNGDGEIDLDSDEDGTELELDLDGSAAAEEDTIYDLSSGDESTEPATIEEPIEAAAEEPIVAEAFHADAFVPPDPEPEPESATAIPETFEAAPFVDEPIGQAPPIEESAAPIVDATPINEPAAEPAFDPAPSADNDEHEPATDMEAEPVAELTSEEPAAELAPDPEPVTDAEPAEDSKSSRRRKRSRSARSRKDKLRSAVRPQPLAPPAPRPPAPVPPAPPPPVAKPTGSGWLVEPARAAAFDPPVPAPAAVTPPPPVTLPPAMASPTIAPAAPIVTAPPIVAPPPIAPPITLAPPSPPPPVPGPPVPQPVAPLPMPRPISAPPVTPPAPIPIRPAPPSAVAPTVKLKTEPPAGFAPPRKARPDPVEDIYSSRAIPDAAQQPSEFPWKLAAAAVAFIALAIVGGKWYMSSSKSEPPPAATEAVAPVAEPVSAAAPKMGRVQIETQPTGARVLLAGKHLGDAPLTIELPAGRHTLTFATSSDSVRRTVRVEAGKTLPLSVPIYRGWLDVVAPIILEVSENGKPIGDTEQSQLLLPPGRHELTFSNRDLDYTSTHVVEIEPGVGKRLTINPQGVANLNASPWAEVWVDGKKIGETPLGDLQLPLGTHEIVFKNPAYGERRMTTTIRANAPVALSVDMRKP
jgi:hypothetical protein